MDGDKSTHKHMKAKPLHVRVKQKKHIKIVNEMIIHNVKLK